MTIDSPLDVLVSKLLSILLVRPIPRPESSYLRSPFQKAFLQCFSCLSNLWPRRQRLLWAQLHLRREFHLRWNDRSLVLVWPLCYHQWFAWNILRRTWKFQRKEMRTKSELIHFELLRTGTHVVSSSFFEGFGKEPCPVRAVIQTKSTFL